MALARCLRDFPRFNASLSADGKTLILKDYVHIGIAVDTPHGLMVPVIRNADTKGPVGHQLPIWPIWPPRAGPQDQAPDEMGGASMTSAIWAALAGWALPPSSTRRNWPSSGSPNRDRDPLGRRYPAPCADGSAGSEL
jgi:hypothetical protein